MKHRLDESENVNERLAHEQRLAAQELLLYKSLVDPSRDEKDYREIRSTIEKVLRENERLTTELHKFKTSDPVYEQVQLLERANQQLKSRFTEILDECERLRSENIELHQQQQRAPPQAVSSPQQVQ